MISGNHFPPNPHVWLQRKIQFSGNHLPVDQNLRLWPENEFTLSFSLQFISGSRKTHSNTERKREEKHKTHNNTERTRAPIQPPRVRAQNATAFGESESTEPTAPIYLTPVTPSSARRSPPRRTPDPAQPVDHRSSHSDHRAKHFITVSFPSPVHRSDLCIIYIYIYIYIYIFIYFLFIY